jgi:molybdenum cofactor guanylyltransferase
VAAEPPHPPLTGLILAGGRSSRMGVDKALLEFEGEPLLARVAARLGTVCEEILVASGDGSRLAAFGLPQVADAVPDSGPLGGLIAGLEHAGHPLMAVVAVDMPFASTELLAAMAAMRRSEDAVVPLSADGLEPLHAVYARPAAGTLRSMLAAGTLSLRRALGSLDVTYVDSDVTGRLDPSGRFAWNLNEPGDLPRR